jgi:hypothetical protein
MERGMISEHMERILSEYEEGQKQPGGSDLAAVETAIFLEDAFGIILSEDEIDPMLLGNPDAVRRLVAGKLQAP